MIDITKYKNMSEVYLEESRRIVAQYNRPRVLKTDLWNEECGSPFVGGIASNIPNVSEMHAIEICPDRVKKSIGNLQADIDPVKYHFISGDIRYLPYEDGSFDVLLDLSTIDHIVPEDMQSTVAGYARVIRSEGAMLLISWCDDSFKPEHIVSYSPTTQYYHSERLLSEELLKYFVIEEQFCLIKKDGKSLVEFICTKKGL